MEDMYVTKAEANIFCGVFLTASEKVENQDTLIFLLNNQYQEMCFSVEHITTGEKKCSFELNMLYTSLSSSAV